MRKTRTFSIALVFTATAAQLQAAPPLPPDYPIITSVSGTFTNMASIVVKGSDFGAKMPAAPMLFANFDSSLAPSSLGQRTSWNQVQSLVWSASERCAMASDGSGVWALRVDDPTLFQDGHNIYVHRRVKRSFVVTDDSQNYKSLRAWFNIGNPGYPNIYVAPSNGRVYTEDIGYPPVDSGYWANFRWTGTGWNTEEFIIRASHINVKDGILTCRYNGKTQASGSILTRSSQYSGVMNQLYALHEVIATKDQWSPPWSDNNRIWADDIYVDNTWARVQLGNAEYYTNCTAFAMQLPSAWNASQVTFWFNSSTFGNGQQVYLFVFNAGNEVNPLGFPITIGGSSQPPNTPPTVTLTAPTDYTAFSAPANIPVQATASDSDGGITRVDFLVNGTNLIASDMSAPFSTVWTNVAPGAYEITALATDNGGRTSVSAPARVTVGNVQLLTIAPFADTFLNADHINYVSNSLLSVYTWPDFQIANVPLVGIDLRSIPQNATILSGELRLHLVSHDSSTNTLYQVPLHVLQTNLLWASANGFTSGLNAWAATNCCYQGAPMAQRELSPAYDAIFVDKQPGPKTWNVKVPLEEARARGDTNVIFALNSDASQRADRYRNFASLDHTNAALRPVLRVEYSLPGLQPQIVLSSAERLGDGSFRFWITGTSNVTFRIEGSTNLQNWFELAIVSHAGGSFIFTDEESLPHRFYRVSAVE
jgi:hypothetical protein